MMSGVTERQLVLVRLFAEVVVVVAVATFGHCSTVGDGCTCVCPSTHTPRPIPPLWVHWSTAPPLVGDRCFRVWRGLFKTRVPRMILAPKGLLEPGLHWSNVVAIPLCSCGSSNCARDKRRCGVATYFDVVSGLRTRLPRIAALVSLLPLLDRLTRLHGRVPLPHPNCMSPPEQNWKRTCSAQIIN